MALLPGLDNLLSLSSNSSLFCSSFSSAFFRSSSSRAIRATERLSGFLVGGNDFDLVKESTSSLPCGPSLTLLSPWHCWPSPSLGVVRGAEPPLRENVFFSNQIVEPRGLLIRLGGDPYRLYWPGGDPRLYCGGEVRRWNGGGLPGRNGGEPDAPYLRNKFKKISLICSRFEDSEQNTYLFSTAYLTSYSSSLPVLWWWIRPPAVGRKTSSIWGSWPSSRWGASVRRHWAWRVTPAITWQRRWWSRNSSKKRKKENVLIEIENNWILAN